jgi:RNA polymerase sigma-70 factor, ECF subfamily
MTVLSVSGDFARAIDQYRPDLIAHCYRMLGSVHDAEDAVQETLLRAWRAAERYDESRASMRTWLHRIATNACLDALGRRQRRPLPSGLHAASEDPADPLTTAPGQLWLEPMPDALLTAATADPAAVVTARTGIRLAFIAALQHLPARQRAVLILRDVLGWRAAEVAETLGTSAAAVNSALQRARAQLADRAPAEDDSSEPADRELRALLDRYVAAFERADVAGLTELLRHDVELEMPPVSTWFAGRPAVMAFIAARFDEAPDRWRLRPTRANGQPAVATYLRAGPGTYLAHSIQVLTVADRKIRRIVAFQSHALVAAFGLPPVLSEATSYQVAAADSRSRPAAAGPAPT